MDAWTSKIKGVLVDVLNYRRIILALWCLLICIGLFFVHWLLDTYWASYQYSDVSHILWKLIEVFLSLVVVLFIYERYVHKNLADLVTRAVLDAALLDKDVLKSYTHAKKEIGVTNLLYALHGEEIGKALQDFRARGNILNLDKAKENFVYNISLERLPDNPNFLQAFFQVQFETKLPAGDRLLIENARARNGVDLDRIYSKLVKKSSSLYRYILLSGKDITLDQSVFKVNSFSIEFVDSTQKRQYDFSFNYVAAEDGKHLVVEIIPLDLKAFRKAKGKVCRFDFSIQTIVDSSIRAFPIKLGYPVRTFQSSLTLLREVAESADIVDFMNGQHPFYKDQIPEVSRVIKVSGGVQGWVLPFSGLVYIW